MRTLLILAVLLASKLTFAQDYVAIVHDAEGWTFDIYKFTPGMSTNACADFGTNVCYRVLMTSAEYAAGWDAYPQAKKDAAKTAGKFQRASIDFLEKLTKAFALVVLDEVNNGRAWQESFKAKVANATTLADLKAKVATLPATPERTVEQLKAAVRAKYMELP